MITWSTSEAVVFIPAANRRRQPPLGWDHHGLSVRFLLSPAEYMPAASGGVLTPPVASCTGALTRPARQLEDTGDSRWQGFSKKW
jgi:hypothetical protein